MKTARHHLTWYFLGALLTLVVIVSSLVPGEDLPHWRISDKVEHMVAYVGLALWFGGLMPPRRYVHLALALLALGGGIEIAQGLMGLGREADWRDFYADAFGVAVGISLCLAGLAALGQLAREVAKTALKRWRPLADRMRPRTLAEFVGQPQLLAPGKPLCEAIASRALHSMILWGPPGTGKTTLARLMAARFGRRVHCAVGRAGGHQGHSRSSGARAAGGGRRPSHGAVSR